MAAGLAVDRTGRLFVHTGAMLAPIALTPAVGYARDGVLWSDAIEPRGFKVAWHRVRAELHLEAGAHAQFFFATSDATAKAPPSPALGAGGNGPFVDPRWQSVPLDVGDFFAGDSSSSAIWIGAHFFADGVSTPALAQMRIEYDHPSYARHLPAIYRRPGPAGDMLTRMLSLFGASSSEPEWAIDRLPGLFDPGAAPEDLLA
jgi:hypothetical protein